MHEYQLPWLGAVKWSWGDVVFLLSAVLLCLYGGYVIITGTTVLETGIGLFVLLMGALVCWSTVRIGHHRVYSDQLREALQNAESPPE